MSRSLADDLEPPDELLQTAMIATAAVSELLSAQASAATGCGDAHRAFDAGVPAVQMAAEGARRHV